MNKAKIWRSLVSCLIWTRSWQHLRTFVLTVGAWFQISKGRHIVLSTIIRSKVRRISQVKKLLLHWHATLVNVQLMLWVHANSLYYRHQHLHPYCRCKYNPSRTLSNKFKTISPCSNYRWQPKEATCILSQCTRSLTLISPQKYLMVSKLILTWAILAVTNHP